MTAYEITQDLLASTSSTASMPPKKSRRLLKLRAGVTAGFAAGALLLAAPIAGSAGAALIPTHSAIAASSAESTLPSTITLTTRRTGSVIL